MRRFWPALQTLAEARRYCGLWLLLRSRGGLGECNLKGLACLSRGSGIFFDTGADAADVKIGYAHDHGEEAEGHSVLQADDDFRRDGAAHELLNRGDDDVATIQNRQGEQIDDGEVHVDQHHELEQHEDPLLSRDFEGIEDAHGAVQVTQADVAVGAQQRAQGPVGE